jgi:hypothetical protein
MPKTGHAARPENFRVATNVASPRRAISQQRRRIDGRLLATRFGGKTVEALRANQFGTIVARESPRIVTRLLSDVVGKIKNVPLDSDSLTTARALGITFGT